MRTLLLGLASVVALSVAAGAAVADTISFGDYFAPGDTPPNGFSSLTDQFTPFTVTGPSANFVVETEGGAWSGQFIYNFTVIYQTAPGVVTIAFGSPITSIDGLSAQPYDLGAYQATLTAYDGATKLGESSYVAINAPGLEGTIPSFSYNASAITSITIGVTDDADGFAIGAGLGIPEPASWALMLGGSALVGGAVRRRRPRTA